MEEEQMTFILTVGNKIFKFYYYAPIIQIYINSEKIKEIYIGGKTPSGNTRFEYDKLIDTIPTPTDQAFLSGKELKYKYKSPFIKYLLELKLITEKEAISELI